RYVRDPAPAAARSSILIVSEDPAGSCQVIRERTVSNGDGVRLKARRAPAAALVEDVLVTRAGHWRDQAMSTPGRLAAIGLVLVLLTLACGAATGLATNARE